MARLNFDLDVLRSFVTGVELGSFARAADRLGRSTPALSAQLRKLEEQAGCSVVRKAGRGLALTAEGEVMFAYARRLLDLNDEAVAAVRGAGVASEVRVGFQEDFGEGLLTDVLASFARAHPQVRIDARVSRNAELLEMVGAERLDLALVWESEASSGGGQLGYLPMQWIGDPARFADRPTGEPLPLVMFEAPCLMRSRSTQALDEAGIAWRVAFTSSSLSGIWAAVSAGLGVTVRTRAGMPGHLSVLNGLPALPRIGLGLHYAARTPGPVQVRLGETIRQHLADSLDGLDAS